MVRPIVLALALTGSALSAQQSPIVGVWQITYPGDMRIRNGVVDPIMLSGTLTVQTQGDSLVANLVTDPSPDLPPRPALRLAAKTGPGDAVFVSRSPVTLNMNGSERQATAVSTWTFGAEGDVLKGTLDRKLEGINGPKNPPQPVTGARRK